MEVCRMLPTKHVSLPAQGVDQLSVSAVLEFTTQAGNVNFDHIAESFPVEVIEMLEQLGLGTTALGRCARYSRTRYSIAVRLPSFPLRRTVRSAVLISRSPTFNTAALCPLPRRIRALARARSSPKSNGLAT